MKFSERLGFSKKKSIIQINSVDADIMAGLWNCLSTIIFERFVGISETDLLLERMREPRSNRHEQLGNLQELFRHVWMDYFKLPIDSLPDKFPLAISEIRPKFIGMKWFEIYDFIEFIAQSLSGEQQKEFIKECNSILEREMSGYRFVGSIIAPITDTAELHEIEEAMEQSNQLDFTGVYIHLTNATDKLSDRKNPDYRNSIKESISAVESLVQLISGNQNATLGDALKKIEHKIPLHPALKKGFISIYGYTNDADGIRHALLEESQSDFEDAKYMLIACSAFINYLIMKSQKAGIFTKDE